MQGLRIKRQGLAFVLEQDGRTDGQFSRQGPVRGGTHAVGLEFRVWHHLLRVEFTRPHPDGEHIDQGPVDIGHRQDPLLIGTYGETLVDAAAVRIDAGAQTRGRRLFPGILVIVSVPDIFDGGAVAGHITLHSVRPASQGIDIEDAGGGRDVVDSIVGSHDGRQVLILDQPLVRIEVEFTHVAAVHVRTAYVAVEFAVVGEIMLGSRNGLHIFRVGAHHAPHEAAGHLSRQERIFTIGFAGPAPARIAHRLDHRRPEGQALRSGLEDRAGLVRNGVGHPLRQGRIPGGTDRDAVREGSRAEQADGRICPGQDAVQGFAPDIVVFDAQARNGSHVVAEQGLFLLKG